MRPRQLRFDLRDDRGAALLFVAVVALVLFGFAAIAVDSGMAFNERRQDQSAADVGALAAGQFAKPVASADCTGYTGENLARCNGAVAAMQVADATLDSPSLVNWSDSSKCGTPPTGFITSPITDCVAFNSNLQRAWVRIPTVDQPTFFARVIGTNTVAVSADAIANTSLGFRSQVLPFLLPGISTAEDYNCLKTGPNPDWDVCEDLPSTGNFGSMDFFLYGNDDLGTTEKCSGGTNGRLVSNIARGVDHPLGIHPTGTGAGIEEPDNCPIFSAEPDMVQGQPGVGSNLEEGLLYGGSDYSSTGAYTGRIQTSTGTGYKVRKNQGSTPEAWVDDTPLWHYLIDDMSGLPGIVQTKCDKGVIDTRQEMVDCITAAKNNHVVVFKDEIASSVRLGFTPEVWEWDFLTPGSYYHIKDFRPVYIDATYFGCNASSCEAVYTPGVADTGSCPADPAGITCGTPANGNKTLDAVTAYILSKDILPEIARNPSPGESNQRIFNLSE
jgi:hypothetical protein